MRDTLLLSGHPSKVGAPIPRPPAVLFPCVFPSSSSSTWERAWQGGEDEVPKEKLASLGLKQKSYESEKKKSQSMSTHTKKIWLTNHPHFAYHFNTKEKKTTTTKKKKPNSSQCSPNVSNQRHLKISVEITCKNQKKKKKKEEGKRKKGKERERAKKITRKPLIIPSQHYWQIYSQTDLRVFHTCSKLGFINFHHTDF